jgi:hypothetical protein
MQGRDHLVAEEKPDRSGDHEDRRADSGGGDLEDPIGAADPPVDPPWGVLRLGGQPNRPLT